MPKSFTSAIDQSTVVYEGKDIPEFNGQFVQYAADNADHNICTLDGKYTFHGTVAAVTPSTNHIRCVPRRNAKARELSEASKIKVHHCKGSVAKRFVNSECFRQQALVFDNLASTSEEGKKAGESALVCI